jgi:adenylate kinase
VELRQRVDDSPETVRNRLHVYTKQTEPLVDFYRATGRLAEIVGTGPPAQVYAALQGAVGP